MVLVDSSVLIHLLRIGKLYLLKEFFKKINITIDVYKEIKGGKIGLSEFEKACREWIAISESKNLKEIEEIRKFEGLEKADASLIQLAKEKKDIILTNDRALIIMAKSKNIECWWLTTFILQCLNKKIITKQGAKQILLDLVESGMRLRNDVYTMILKEIEDM